jgi:hypothetical protein
MIIHQVNMYLQKRFSNESVTTIGSVISNATEEFEEVLKQIENQEDKNRDIII